MQGSNVLEMSRTESAIEIGPLLEQASDTLAKLADAVKTLKHADFGPEPEKAPDTNFRPDVLDGRETLSLEELIPHPKNAALFCDPDPMLWAESVMSIASSLASNGQKHPILVTADSVIIAGHKRAQAAKKLGWKSVWVRYVSFESEEAAIDELVADNTARQPISRKFRMAIYRDRAPWLLDTSPIANKDIATVARRLHVSPDTIRRDIRAHRRPAGNISMEQLQEAWQDGRIKLNVTVTQVQGSRNWIVQVRSDRHRDLPIHTAGPGPYRNVMADSLQRARSDYYRRTYEKQQSISEDRINAGLRLRALRMELRLSQKECKTTFDVAQSYISELELGKYSVEAIQVVYDKLLRYKADNSM